MMNRIGRERGWTGITRQDFDALRTKRGALVVGSPDEVVEKILFQHELFGHERFLAQMSVGSLPHAQVLRSIELFGTRGRAGGTGRARQAGGLIDELTLLDWKRRIFELYAEIRADRDPGARLGAAGATSATSSSARTSSRRSQPSSRACVHRPAALPLRPGAAGDRARRAGRARAARDRHLGRAARTRSRGSLAPGSSSTATADARPLLARRATAAGSSSRSPTRRAAPRPTAPAATCSTRSRAPISARRTAASCSTSTSRTTPRAPTTRAGCARSRRPATA